MHRRRASSRRALAGFLALAALAALCGCGNKGPLRLAEQRPAERADVPRASVREGRVTLEFEVPAHRLFPEREDPWVLARILRRSAPGGEFAEVGTILEPGGFAFEAPLSWTEDPGVPGPLAYRVEFRDAARRRRALSEPVEVALGGLAAAPTGLRAAGDDRAVRLSWSAPAGAGDAVLYRVYRREGGGDPEPLTPAAGAARELADTRVRAGRQYCYRVRAVAVAGGLASEGPPSDEVCVRTEDLTPPPPPAAARAVAVGGGVQVGWDAVDATDLLGYFVYRAVGDGPLERLTTAPVSGTAYRDETGALPEGTRCRYAVTAVDTAAARNESAFSPAAEVVTGGGAAPRPGP